MPPCPTPCPSPTVLGKAPRGLHQLVPRRASLRPPPGLLPILSEHSSCGPMDCVSPSLTLTLGGAIISLVLQMGGSEAQGVNPLPQGHTAHVQTSELRFEPRPSGSRVWLQCHTVLPMEMGLPGLPSSHPQPRLSLGLRVPGAAAAVPPSFLLPPVPEAPSWGSSSCPDVGTLQSNSHIAVSPTDIVTHFTDEETEAERY